MLSVTELLFMDASPPIIAFAVLGRLGSFDTGIGGRNVSGETNRFCPNAGAALRNNRDPILRAFVSSSPKETRRLDRLWSGLDMG